MELELNESGLRLRGELVDILSVLAPVIDHQRIQGALPFRKLNV